MMPFARFEKPLNIVVPKEIVPPDAMRADRYQCIPRQRDGKHRQQKNHRPHCQDRRGQFGRQPPHVPGRK